MANAVGTASQLPPAYQRGDAELSLTNERLRVDREPGLSSRPQDVSGVEVLVEKHLLPL